MRFLIRRTSTLSAPEKRAPCKKAVPCSEKTDGLYSFEIELGSLEELLELSAEEGDIIIAYTFANGTPCLEIYDDYRE